jgi:hypothetical protein
MDRAHSISGEERNAYEIVVGKPEAKKLPRPRNKCEDNN